MQVYLIKCYDCGYRWKLSDNYLDDGREVFCPNCGSPDYILDAIDETEDQSLKETTW